MRQGGEGETSVGEADFFGIFRQNAVGRLDQHPLVFGRGLTSGGLDAVPDNGLVDFGHTAVWRSPTEGVNCGVWFRKAIC
jgi:hypothetical protein